MKNQIEFVDTDYFRGDLSINIYLLRKIGLIKSTKIVYIYNFEGYHFRLFLNLKEFIFFLNNAYDIEPLNFENLDEALDYLENYEF
jgi:hypothetical protein